MKKRIRGMRKRIEVIALIAVALVVGVIVKANVSANVKDEVAEQQAKENTSYRVEFDEMDYYSYCKSGRAEQTLEYSINDVPGEKVILSGECKNVQCGIPSSIVYAYEFQNVKDGDVIKYKISYVNTYSGFADENVSEGEIIVDIQDEEQPQVQENESKSYRVELEKMDYYGFSRSTCKTRTLEYSVNGSEVVKVTLEPEFQNVQCGIPSSIVYAYEFQNVKAGDVINYKISYVNTYAGFADERVNEGEIIVE